MSVDCICACQGGVCRMSTRGTVGKKIRLYVQREDDWWCQRRENCWSLSAGPHATKNNSADGVSGAKQLKELNNALSWSISGCGAEIKNAEVYERSSRVSLLRQLMMGLSTASTKWKFSFGCTDGRTVLVDVSQVSFSDHDERKNLMIEDCKRDTSNDETCMGKQRKQVMGNRKDSMVKGCSERELGQDIAKWDWETHNNRKQCEIWIDLTYEDTDTMWENQELQK